MRIRLAQRGDTLVEVMIAMAVITSVLGAAFVSANRSLQASRAAQERGEATRVAESEAEQIKVLAKDAANGMFDSSQIYCIAFSGPNANMKQTFGGYDPFAVAVTLQTDNFSAYPSGCKQSFYNAAIKYTPPSPAGSLNDTFTIQVRWNRVGQQNDEVKMVYRLH